MTDSENNTITRATLANSVHNQLGFSKAESLEMVGVVFDEISEALAEEDLVKISSFGTFKIRHKNPRVGRNPKTKEEVPIVARKSISFYISNILKKHLNEA